MLIFPNWSVTLWLDSHSMVISMNDQNVSISDFDSMMTFGLLSFCKFDHVKFEINAAINIKVDNLTSSIWTKTNVSHIVATVHKKKPVGIKLKRLFMSHAILESKRCKFRPISINFSTSFFFITVFHFDAFGSVVAAFSQILNGFYRPLYNTCSKWLAWSKYP